LKKIQPIEIKLTKKSLGRLPIGKPTWFFKSKKQYDRQQEKKVGEHNG
jgi:hypothetical protein